MDLDEKERIKSSFTKVKEDIEALKMQLNELKSLIESLIKNQNNSRKAEEKQEIVPQTREEISSTGNQGVYAGIHSFNRQSTDTGQTFNIQTSPQNRIRPANFDENPSLTWSLSNIKEIDNLFLTLTKQEFIVFLSIYQVEDDQKRGVSYLELSQKMSLSEGCIRTYVSQMLKKGIPLQKIRVNNKLTLLIIHKDFKSLNLKQRLFSLFSKNDLNQTTLL